MEIVTQVFDKLISLLVELWNTALGRWSIFGSFIIFSSLLRKVARTFNRLKS